ncbi:unnamed protein product [Danaus chrysippus]|uniref:(African queen) hypothetical protein n=1 Tax=Danaus chrysippus TaxID=151541 RepID=A0A8J2WDP2_9NEOP|nr:unnamed protein product [Danaus chrysippus]
MVEGWRLIVDGLEAKCALRYVIFSQTEDLNKLRPFLPNTGVKIYKIPYKEIELWSNVDTPPGIIGVFDTPTADNVKWLSQPMPIHLICDNVRTPGNLGGILRAAAGVGCEKVLLTKGCVDLWDPKVVRSGAGAHFRQPIISSIDWEELPNHLAKETTIFIADSNGKLMNDDFESENDLVCNIPVVPYYSVDFGILKHITLIIGGETEGISENSYRLAANKNGLRLNIPLQKGVDSLNTGMATAVIAFEMRKQLIQVQAKAHLDKQGMNKEASSVNTVGGAVAVQSAGVDPRPPHPAPPLLTAPAGGPLTQLANRICQLSFDNRTAFAQHLVFLESSWPLTLQRAGPAVCKCVVD